MASVESTFIKKNVRRLLERFDLSYYREGDCIEYFIVDHENQKQISYAIVLSVNRRSHEIHVSRFCPELYKQLDSKYLSAACFYLVIHHFAHAYHLEEPYDIALETRPATYKRFFAKLSDFELQLKGIRLCETAEVWGEYPPVDVDTEMIEERTIEHDQLAFLV
jgi:hypothetical protein